MALNLSNKLTLTNPNKHLWDDPEISKLQYVSQMLRLAPFLIRQCENRLLTCIRYPNGINGGFFYQKNMPNYAPSWIETVKKGDISYINLKDEQTLLWLCNLACIEFHISFNRIEDSDVPVYLMLDLDPSKGVEFHTVVEAGLMIRDELTKLNISSIPKTSGATGIQILIPHGKRLNYREGRKFSYFLGSYFSRKYPDLFTIERKVKERGKKIYFDYLQMWPGKSIIAPYSPRARKGAPISMPIKWSELEKATRQTDYNLTNCSEMLSKRGDILAEYENTLNDPLIDIIKEIEILH